jgi:hypothetical protein
VRLVGAIKPKTYRRTDIESDDRRVGHIANDWERELPAGMRNIMGASASPPDMQNIVGAPEDGALLALDYSRIVPVLHGALLSALARIEALESR